MKTLKFTLLALLLYTGITAQECDKLLQDGLYSLTRMTRTESFSKDLRTYYLSEQFKTDMRSGKWGSSLTIPVEGIPFTIGISDQDERYTQLRNKLLSITELKLEANTVQVLLQSIPNTNLYEAYNRCLEISDRNKPGFTQGTNIETEDAVVFTIYYKPSSPNDPMPKVLAFSVYPEGSIISGGLKIGDHLDRFTTLVTCRRQPEKDLILTLQTDRGAISSKAAAQESLSSGKELPLGTIISSFLTFEQFNAATKNNEKSPGGIWTAQKSKWAPCDGRSVPNSKLQLITSQNLVPDLRGVFLRGLNLFDPNQPLSPPNADRADPDSRAVGSFQSDEFKKHNHPIVTADDGTPPNTSYKITGYGKHFGPTVNSNDAGTAPETRPKNVAVYYYIRIN